MKRLLFFLPILLFLFNTTQAQDTLNLLPPGNFQGITPAQTDYAHLTWEEPFDTIAGTTPPGLLGYNIYRDGEVIGSIDVPALEYYDLNLEFLTYVYYISAVYDLSFYGYPGETGESPLEGPVEVTLCCLVDLPFTETFTTGVFETNQWTAEENWNIAGQSGNPPPSAVFSISPVIANYSSSLTSYWIPGSYFNDGEIFLDFDFRLNDINLSGTEFLYVDVYDGEQWINKATYVNSQEIDWTRPHLNITNEAKGEIFKIRFRAEGESGANIHGWSIDNIEVYRYCVPPVNLTAHLEGASYCHIVLEWEAPDTTGIGAPGWLEWDNGVNADAIGCAGGETFYIASRFTPEELAEHAGAYLTKIRIFLYEEGGVITLKVWTGANASQLVLSQPVDSYVPGQWNEFELNNPVLITGDIELWFGYTSYTEVGAYVPGLDAGPAVAGYGDMISLYGDVWESLYQAFGFNNNWNLAAYVEPLPDSRSLDYYNVYRDNEFLTSTNETSYVDQNVLPNYEYCYMVTSVYEDCESDFTNTACEVACPVSVNDIDVNQPDIYPNPASSLITVSGKSIERVIIYDILGNKIQEKKIPSTQESTAMDIKNLTNGVYLVKITKASGESIVRKMVVKH